MTSTPTPQTDPADLVPIDQCAAAIEAWFAEAGLTATVTAACADPACAVCAAALADAA